MPITDNVTIRYPDTSLPLIRLLLDLTNVDYAQSIRQVFYRVVDTPGSGVPKTDNGYRRVQRLLKKLREDGVIAYDQIVDQSRLILLDGHHPSSRYQTPDYYAQQATQYLAYAYQEDYWQNKDTYLQVWCESRGAAATIQDTCAAYGVGLIPARGQTSLTLIHEAAQIIASRAKEEVNILYIGDYDEAGVNIGISVYERLYTILSNRWNGHIYFHRIAINDEQIADWNLPTKPAKTVGRHLRNQTVEVESIPVPTLRTLVEDSIEEYLPLDERDEIIERIQSRRYDLMSNPTILGEITDIARRWFDEE